MAEFSMEQELAQFRKSAEEGYNLANEGYHKIEQTLDAASKKIVEADYQQNKVSRLKNTKFIDDLNAQINTLKQNFKIIRSAIDNLREKQKDFSIVVYGRTMAGKSTLMEILTRGDGKSIGLGAKRKTKDVRSYYWNSLKIIDVPGFEAYGEDGRKDEKLALDAAKSADLILFLLTDDAPKPEEGNWLAQMKNLGKPVIGVINVKMTFNINDDLDLEDLQELLADKKRIEIILNQFRNFAQLHNQDWSDIKWVATHLNAAYQAHPCRANNKKVYAISNFAQVENFILEKVKNDGKFLRTKNFIDSVAVPMNNIILKIFQQSGDSLKQSGIWFDKRKQYDKWSVDFCKRVNQRFDRLYEELKERLDREIYDFAETHYEDEKVNAHWENCLRNLEFDTRYQNLLKELADECERKRKELSDQLTQELSYSFQGNMRTNISLEGTTPWGQYAAMVLPNLLMFVPGIGWGARIAIGVGSALFSFLFDDKEQKIREAKAKLRNDLSGPSHEMLLKMHNQVIDIYNENIYNKGVAEFYNILSEYAHMFAQLGKAQAELAAALRNDYQEINLKLFNAAIIYKGLGTPRHYQDSMRIPGEISVVLARNSNLLVKPIADLLGEKFIVLNLKSNFEDELERILDCDFKYDAYPLEFDTDSKKAERAYSIMPKDKVNPTKLKLAQQFSPYPIITR